MWSRTGLIRRLNQRRYQREGKPLNNFVLEIETLNGHLIDRFDEWELLSILRDNMSPSLRNVTLSSSFNSIEHFRSSCHKYETFWKQTLNENRVSFGINRLRPARAINLLNYEADGNYQSDEFSDRIPRLPLNEDIFVESHNEVEIAYIL